MWVIATEKDNVWVKWVHSVYIKAMDWWDYSPTNGSSWYWKRVFAVKEEMKQVYNRKEI